MTELYTRPAKTKATALGERNRVRWTRHLRTKFSIVLPIIDVMAAEEASILVAIRRQTNAVRHWPWSDRPRWASIQIRIDQMAIIEMLQARHLMATGREISRAEVLAALMAEGVDRIINHADFGGGPADADAPTN